jgi:acyl-[acyl-carrier-protein]-phospholipid O-acyltransferase/long-chain-fatty-acid--[acyl-carrier-protein] ligase
LRRCRRNLSRVKVADSSGAQLTGGKLLAGSVIMKRLLKRHVYGPDESTIGVLLPPTVAGTVVNAAIALSRKVAVNLNYTLSEKDINYCIREAGIKHIITSRKFMEKLSFKLDAELVYAEDLKEKTTTLDKAIGGFQAFVVPTLILERWHGLTKIRQNDVLGIIFTSGSTGEPKGVMLSQRNVMSNIDSTDALFHWKPTDSIMGIMPFFHSFGFTLSMWMTLTTDIRAVFHYNPIDARTIGKLCEEHQVSIMMGTPTFLRSYLKRCTPEQLKYLELAVVGAEKLPLELAEEFQEKFGVFPTEGYGATELSPLAAANVPKKRTGSEHEVGQKFGTVGRVIPGSMVRVVDPETGDVLGANEPGVLQFAGPNVMLGYLNQPEKTQEVIQDGWYHTGDMGTIDEAGFITLTGRLNRFSKIGGEMVPHVKIEEHLRAILKADFPEDENLESAIAVTAVPDEKKGEKLVVLHKPLPRPVEEILKKLDEENLPNLWRPSRDCFVEVECVPILGTGKLDLKGIKETALARLCPQAAESLKRNHETHERHEKKTETRNTNLH